MAKKYLDDSGLSYFYQKIKAKFYTKTQVDEIVADIAIYATHDNNGTVTIHNVEVVPDASTKSY